MRRCTSVLLMMACGIAYFGRPNSSSFSRRGTRSFRRQGWVNAQDASRLSFGLHNERQSWEAAAAHCRECSLGRDRGSMLNNLTLLR